jgi:hypothetical protein
MPATSVLLAKKATSPNATRLRPAPRPQGSRPQAEDLLRDLAFVYHAVRAVKASMTESRP